MPAVTTLAFYRERQSVDNFDYERPKSLAALRAAARAEVDHILQQLDFLEKQYISPHQTQGDFIRENLFTLKRLMLAANVTQIRKSFDIEIVLESVNSFGQESIKYLESMQKIRALQTHVTEFMADSFVPFDERLKKILAIMQKYCLSFYRGQMEYTPDKYLETPYKYEQQRTVFASEIRRCLLAINEKTVLFGSVGLDVTVFTLNVQTLARKVGCVDMPIFLLFPEACDKVREACKQVVDWLEADKEYTEALKNDVALMHKYYLDFTEKRQDAQTRMIRVRHGYLNHKKEIEIFENSRDEFKAQKAKVHENQHRALVELKKVEYHIHRARTTLSELKKHPNLYSSPEELKRVVTDNIIEIKRQKTMYPKVIKKLEIVDNTAKSCDQKDSEYEDHKRQSLNLKIDLDKVLRELDRLDIELERVERYKKILRHIFVLKTTNSSLKKIFHDLQLDDKLKVALERSSSPRLPTRDIEYYQQVNPLDNALKVTAHFIENDWYRLFYCLPFYPPRGLVDLDADIDTINKRWVRGSKKELAREALSLWKRKHTRANLNSVKDALINIGRTDIVQRIDTYLARKLKGEQFTTRSNRDTALPPIVSV